MGFVNPSAVQDPVVLTPLRDYHSIHNDNHFNLIDGSFHFIVDTGCSMSCSPCEKDFSELRYLLRPIVLHGIAGNSTVTQGGTMRFQCINTKGEVVTIETFGYYNPNMNVRLFSPPAFFSN
jgi:hypothetical protein